MKWGNAQTEMLKTTQSAPASAILRALSRTASSLLQTGSSPATTVVAAGFERAADRTFGRQDSSEHGRVGEVAAIGEAEQADVRHLYAPPTALP